MDELHDKHTKAEFELNKFKHSESILAEASQKQIVKIDLLEREDINYKQIIFDQKQEIKRFQDSLSYMSRQLDQDKLASLDNQIALKQSE